MPAAKKTTPKKRTPRKKTTETKPKRLTGAARTAHNKKAFLSALKKSLGIITTAAEETGVGRRTVYEWIEKDSNFAEEVAEIEELAVDYVESKLFERIKGVTIGKMVEGELKVYETPPDTTSIIFYLKTKGKARGYIEKQEVDLNHLNGLTLEVVDGPKVISLDAED